MSDVKRYEIAIGGFKKMPWMGDAPEGRYVLWEDYEANNARLARMEARAVEAEKQLANRDANWSASLETGYSDCPPRNPDEVAKWWKSHSVFVGRIARSAVAETLAKMSGTNFTELRKIILACDEMIGPDGGCTCTHLIGAKIIAPQSQALELAEQMLKIDERLRDSRGHFEQFLYVEFLGPDSHFAILAQAVVDAAKERTHG